MIVLRNNNSDPAVSRTKLTNVGSENMFKDLIAGHARELVNNQGNVFYFLMN